MKCLYCGAEITKKSHHKEPPKYCNNACFKAARGCKTYGIGHCLECGKEFQETRDRPNKFCSRECVYVYRSKKAVVDRMSMSEINQETYGLYVEAVKQVDLLRRKIEREKRCVFCGKWFVSTFNRTLCSDECARKYDNAKRDRRIYKNGKPDLSITLPLLFNRDGGVCKICGMQLSFDGDPNSETYPSIDHIQPLAKGGLHIWNNVQLTCRRCNTLKRDTWDSPPSAEINDP